MHCTLYIVNCSLFNTQEERLSIYWHLELNEHFQMFSTNCNFSIVLWHEIQMNQNVAKTFAIPVYEHILQQIANMQRCQPVFYKYATNVQRCSQVSTNMQQKCKDASQPVFYKIWCWHKCMIMHKLLWLICLPFILYTHQIA